MNMHVDRRIKNYSLVLLFVACFMFVLLGYVLYIEGKEVQLQNFQEIGVHYTKFAERAMKDVLISNKIYSQVMTDNQFVRTFTNKPYDLLMKYRAEIFVSDLGDEIDRYKCIKVLPKGLENLALTIHKDPNFVALTYNIDDTYFDYYDYYISPIRNNAGQQEFTIVSPIYFNEKLVGQLQLVIDMTDFIEEFIMNTLFKETGYVFIIDEAKNIISHSSKATSDFSNLLDDLPQNRSIVEKSVKGVERYFYLRNVKFSNTNTDDVMHIVFTQETSELFSFNNKIIISTIRVISIFVVLFLLITILSTRIHIKLVTQETQQAVDETLDTEVKKQTRVLRKMAETDSLTGLYNHGSMYKIIEEAIETSKLTNTALTLMMLDVDYFKDVNDTYGHPIGDDVLKRIAEILLDNIRDLDVAGRYGGEEYIVLLRNTPLVIGYTVAERIRKSILATDFTDEKIRISISIGLSQWQVGDVATFIKKADNNLYVSKSQGRNKTTF